MNVLIVDDDLDQLAIRRMLLSEFGFEVLTASDEASAVQAARTTEPVCAIVDLFIPTEDVGLRLIRNLKKIRPRMRILVLTGGRKERLEELPERALVDRIIEKGSPTAELLAELKAGGKEKASGLTEALERDGVIVFDLKVTARAARTEITGQMTSGVLQVKMAAVPDQGRANEELCKLLAEYFSVNQSNVELLSGKTSSTKRARIRRP